jgi:ribonuclease HII
MMEALDREYPGYGFATHKGYGTPEHRAALQRLGPSDVHRMSFPVIRELRGECSPLFYELRVQLFAARTRDALAELEAALRAHEASLVEQEYRKLRILILRRWKLVGQRVS